MTEINETAENSINNPVSNRYGAGALHKGYELPKPRKGISKNIKVAAVLERHTVNIFIN
jgi:hypothetical protein